VKSPSLATLNKKLWRVFSEYIRRKDADEDGYVNCISCGQRKHYTDLHAGHYWAKSVSLSLRFDERNVHPQCAGCNTFRHGNMAQYALALQREYGDRILQELDDHRKVYQNLKYSKSDYLEMIETYKNKLANLEMLGKSQIFGAR